MAYPIEYATEADAPALARINIESFRRQGILNDIFPEAGEATLTEYKAIYATKHLANPQMHVLKVTDPVNGEVVGYGRWLIPASVDFAASQPALSEQGQVFAQDPTRFFPRPMNEALFAEFRRLLEYYRKKHTTDDDMGEWPSFILQFKRLTGLVLDLLATLPARQGRGIGSAVLEWGTSKADAWGRRLYLEATPDGLPLYLKYGWRPVEEMVLDRAQFGGQGRDTFMIMIRHPVPQ